MTMKSTVAAAAVAFALVAAPAFAQQEGLVNVNVEGVNVQVPVGIAAQVCPNVSANVIAEAVGTQEAVCEITQETAAQHDIAVGQGGGQDQGQQSGLVNVNVEGVNVQVPVGVAAQICPNVSANVIAEAVGTQEAVCEIDQATAAEHNIGMGQGGGQGQGQGQSQRSGG
jgi:hypothetical protein